MALAPFNLAPLSSDGRLVVVLRPLLLLQLGLSLTIVTVELGRRRSIGGPPIPRVLFTAAAILPATVLLSALSSDDRWIGAGGAATALALAATTTATALATPTSAEAARLLRWLVAGTTVGAVVGLVVFANGGDLLGTSRFSGDISRLGFQPRLTRPWGHANVAAMAIGPALVIAMVMAAAPGMAGSIGGPGGDRWPSHRSLSRGPAVCVILTVALVLTYSRGGLVGALIATVVGGGLFVRRGDTNRRPEALVVAVVLVAVGLTMMLAPGWRDRAISNGEVRDFSASVDAPEALEIDQAGTAAAITVGNSSGRRWPAAGQDKIELSARWLVAEGAGGRQIAAEQRWPLPRDVEPGESVTIIVDLDAVVADGGYDILWDLLADQEAYFLQFSGLSASTGVTVTGSTVTGVETTPLVTPRTNLTRGEIWRIASDAFRSNPLLGVGPMQLLAFAEPDLGETKRFPGGHAHNLVLEALATWGLVGTVPLLALLAGGGWRALRLAWRGNRIGRAVLLGLVAFGLHSTVEWQINEVSAAIPLAVLVGIGWSPAAEIASPD